MIAWLSGCAIQHPPFTPQELMDTSDCSTVKFSISEQGRAYNIEIIDPLYPSTSDERIIPILQHSSFSSIGKLPKDAKFQQTFCFRSSWN